MATYKCNESGMSVNTSCGECNQPLVDGYLDLDDGSKGSNITMQARRLLKL